MTDVRHAAGSSRLEVDAAVVGAGPAGCAAALILLQSGARVAIVDSAPRTPQARIGESLPAAANRLLRRLGVWPDFVAANHGTCHARTSAWGEPVPRTEDAITDLDGPGWLLDRSRFDQDLRAAARAGGARIIAPARALSTTHVDGRWLIRHTGAGSILRARVLVDAAGRASHVSEPSGVARLTRDRLVCVWTRLRRSRPGPAQTYVESSPLGWWYTAPVPGGHRILAFHTDSDLARRHRLHTHLMATASPALHEHLSDSDVDSPEPVRVCRAGSARLPTPADAGRVAVGDAAMSFDPLSGQGLFNALYSGVFGGRAARDLLDGDPAAASVFVERLASVWPVYQSRLSRVYEQEQRWATEPFWLRRHAGVG